jgi:hypothetical protein
MLVAHLASTEIEACTELLHALATTTTWRVQGDSPVFSRQSTGVQGQALCMQHNAQSLHCQPCHSLCAAGARRSMIPIRVDPELRGMAAPHAHAPSYVASPVAALARPSLPCYVCYCYPSTIDHRGHKLIRPAAAAATHRQSCSINSGELHGRASPLGDQAGSLLLLVSSLLSELSSPFRATTPAYIHRSWCIQWYAHMHALFVQTK